MPFNESDLDYSGPNSTVTAAQNAVQALNRIAVAFSNIRLTAARTYYVATAAGGGSDSNNGKSAAAPFLTIQKAFDTVANLNNNGFTITISVAAGSYAGATANGPYTGNGDVILLGASAATTTLTSQLLIRFAAKVSVCGFTLAGGLNVTDDGTARIVSTQSPALIFPSMGGFHMNASRAGKIRVEALANYTITGGAAAHLSASNNGSLVYFSQTGTVTVTAATSTPNFSTAFYTAQMNGSCNWNNYGKAGGNVTGLAFSIDTNGSLKNSGAGAAFPNGLSLPGTYTVPPSGF